MTAPIFLLPKLIRASFVRSLLSSSRSLHLAQILIVPSTHFIYPVKVFARLVS